MPNVDIQVRDRRFFEYKKGLKPFCHRIIKKAWNDQEPAEISLVLADDEFVHQLNREYRGKDCPTNVLSFETDDRPSEVGVPWLAGDIIVSFDTVLKEAQAQDKSFESHLAHLIIHGTLHLQGYDHLTETEAQEMEALEVKLMQEMGYQNPYLGVME